MNEQKAREILNGCITKRGTLYNFTDKSKPYMNSGYGSTIVIDGVVTIRELKAIVWWMQNIDTESEEMEMIAKTTRRTSQCEICGVSFNSTDLPICDACHNLLWNVSREELTELVARVRKVEHLRKPLEDIEQDTETSTE